MENNITDEQRKILIRNLCMRIPYITFVSVDENTIEAIGDEPEPVHTLTSVNYYGEVTIDDMVVVPVDCVRPYLRSMDTMTYKEKMAFIDYAGFEREESINGRHYEEYLYDCAGTPEEPCANEKGVEWLLMNYFDFIYIWDENEKKHKSMIEMGLAVEAPEGMYKENVL